MTHRRRCGGTATLPPPTPPGLPPTGGNHDHDTHPVHDLPPADPGSTVRCRAGCTAAASWRALTFLVVRDRTGLAQVVVPRRDRRCRPRRPPVEVVGTATANAQAPGGVEVTDADDPSRSPSRPTPRRSSCGARP